MSRAILIILIIIIVIVVALVLIATIRYFRSAWSPDESKVGGWVSPFENYVISRVAEITGKSFDQSVHFNWLNMQKPGGMIVTLEIDGYNDELKLAVEVQGPYHYYLMPNQTNPEVLRGIVAKDKLKLTKCAENNVRLLVLHCFIPFDQLDDYIKSRLQDFGIPFTSTPFTYRPPINPEVREVLTPAIGCDPRYDDSALASRWATTDWLEHQKRAQELQQAQQAEEARQKAQMEAQREKLSQLHEMHRNASARARDTIEQITKAQENFEKLSLEYRQTGKQLANSQRSYRSLCDTGMIEKSFCDELESRIAQQQKSYKALEEELSKSSAAVNQLIAQKNTLLNDIDKYASLIKDILK